MPVLGPAVRCDPEIMVGTPVFAGTRVPFQTLLDYLEGGDSLDAFLDDFPTVSRELAVGALGMVNDGLITGRPVEDVSRFKRFLRGIDTVARERD